MDEYKQRQRAMWSAGDYATLSERIRDVGERVVARAGVDAGMRVLDVACGAGNASIPAARAGAEVTGLDLVPELLDAGRRKAAAEGLEIAWVEGDAENLPFESGVFDRVFSTFGHMFAPRHQRTADEMARVCSEGGVVALCCWTPEGASGEVMRAAGSYMPPPPDFASPPMLWGTEDHVRAMFASTASDFEFEHHATIIEAESIDAFLDLFAESFGPLVTAKQMLGARFEELRAEIRAIWERRNTADDGGFVLPQEYLLSVVRL